MRGNKSIEDRDLMNKEGMEEGAKETMDRLAELLRKQTDRKHGLTKRNKAQ